jgi:replicative DNA helicase
MARKVTSLQGAQLALEHIEERLKGNVFLETRWRSINNAFMGGLAPNTLVTVAGMSGSGKSSYVNMIEHDICTLNPGHKVAILNFSLEMLVRNQFTRKMSYITKASTRELWSVGKNISKELLAKCKQSVAVLGDMPIWYVDGYIDTNEVFKLTTEFQEEHKNEWVIIILDHTLLVEGIGDERKVIKELQNVWKDTRKVGKTTIIQISQLNRGIEEGFRLRTKAHHYPIKSDLSTSDSMYQLSDYVLVLHRPEMLGITHYGPNGYKTKNIAYIHVLKNREGETFILPYKEDFAHGNLEELKSSDVTQGQEEINVENTAKAATGTILKAMKGIKITG